MTSEDLASNVIGSFADILFSQESQGLETLYLISSRTIAREPVVYGWRGGGLCAAESSQQKSGWQPAMD